MPKQCECFRKGSPRNMLNRRGYWHVSLLPQVGSSNWRYAGCTGHTSHGLTVVSPLHRLRHLSMYEGISVPGNKNVLVPSPSFDHAMILQAWNARPIQLHLVIFSRHRSTKFIPGNILRENIEIDSCIPFVKSQ